jgi:type III pantothenate kinase
MLHAVADLGNSRLKWGRIDRLGRLAEVIGLPLDDPKAWAAAWETWCRDDPAPPPWAISSVNPPVAARLAAFLDHAGAASVRWFRCAADVPVRHALEHAETAGADRAFAVSAALRLIRSGRPGLVVSCGTAITVERITRDGIWQGGAIMPGLGLAARSLHLHTALLPAVALAKTPATWGSSTRPAMEAGVFWGAVGAVRELLVRYTVDLGGEPSVIWTGGDAALLAAPVSGASAHIEPDLVLLGLAALDPADQPARSDRSSS